MKNYRSKMAIIAKLLEISRMGTTKTQMMYSVYLSWTQQKKYLAFLQEYDLITFDDNAKLYRTTDKGIKFLDYASEIGRLMNEPIDQT